MDKSKVARFMAHGVYSKVEQTQLNKTQIQYAGNFSNKWQKWQNIFTHLKIVMRTIPVGSISSTSHENKNLSSTQNLLLDSIILHRCFFSRSNRFNDWSLFINICRACAGRGDDEGKRIPQSSATRRSGRKSSSDRQDNLNDQRARRLFTQTGE